VQIFRLCMNEMIYGGDNVMITDQFDWVQHQMGDSQVENWHGDEPI
jgi:hypothetical protein